MFLLICFIAIICAGFFHCQALKSGLGVKRWTVAGLFFGPLVWPMFCMNKRMKLNQLFGFNYLIIKA